MYVLTGKGLLQSVLVLNMLDLEFMALKNIDWGELAQHLGDIVLLSVKDHPRSSVPYCQGSLNSCGLNTYLFLHWFHATFLRESENCLCISCNTLVSSSFLICRGQLLFHTWYFVCFCLHSSSFLSSILSLALTFFPSLRQLVLGISISKQ